MITLTQGCEVPWAGFEAVIETDRGPMTLSEWGMRDGWTLYESVTKNVRGAPTFFVLTANDKVSAVIEIDNEDDESVAWDKILQTKRASSL